jgi:hypothetical protein
MPGSCFLGDGIYPSVVNHSPAPLYRQSPARAAAEQRDAARPRLPPSSSTRPTGRFGRTGQQLNDATERIGAIQIAAAPAIDFNAIDRCLWDFVPEHPSAERVVQRHAVREDERTAGRGATNAAQRDALRGRIRVARRRAAEQSKSRHRLQGIVDGHRSAGQQIVG